MSELIDSFDRLKAEELHKTQAAQKEIVRLLQTLARKLEHMENPSRLNADRLAEMKSDLDFKQMQMLRVCISIGVRFQVQIIT